MLVGFLYYSKVRIGTKVEIRIFFATDLPLSSGGEQKAQSVSIVTARFRQGYKAKSISIVTFRFRWGRKLEPVSIITFRFRRGRSPSQFL